MNIGSPNDFMTQLFGGGGGTPGTMHPGVQNFLQQITGSIPAPGSGGSMSHNTPGPTSFYGTQGPLGSYPGTPTLSSGSGTAMSPNIGMPNSPIQPMVQSMIPQLASSLASGAGSSMGNMNPSTWGAPTAGLGMTSGGAQNSGIAALLQMLMGGGQQGGPKQGNPGF